MSLNSPPKTQRLFFALWPADELRVQLARIARQIMGKQDKIVHPKNLHLTLVFLGSVTVQQRICAERVANAVAGTAFELRLEQIGYWSRPQVVWFGPREIPEPLIDLVRQLNKGLKACAHQPETRCYQAHITLARKVIRRFPISWTMPLAWQVEYFCLVQSVACPGGVQYQILRTWPLAKAS
jgi:2'-5' RNA ligase